MLDATKNMGPQMKNDHEFLDDYTGYPDIPGRVAYAATCEAGIRLGPRATRELHKLLQRLGHLERAEQGNKGKDILRKGETAT